MHYITEKVNVPLKYVSFVLFYSTTTQQANSDMLEEQQWQEEWEDGMVKMELQSRHTVGNF